MINHAPAHRETAVAVEALHYPVGSIPPREFLDPTPHERVQAALRASKGVRERKRPLESFVVVRDVMERQR